MHRWADWLCANVYPKRLFGLGESMGAGVLLQALPLEPRIKAAVAESAFASIEEVAYDRLGRYSHRALFWPVVQSAFIYGRLKYGVWFGSASPVRALAQVDTPVLLINDGRDDSVSPQHVRALIAAGRHISVWEVPDSIHTGAIGIHPQQFAQHVVGWFQQN